MDSDGELQICDQSHTSDIVDIEYSSNNFESSLENQIEKSHCINFLKESEKDQISKEHHTSLDCVENLNSTKDATILTKKAEVPSIVQNTNGNTRKRNLQGVPKKIITPLMKNALKQSRKEVSLLECTQKIDKNNTNTTIVNNDDDVKKEDIKPNKIRGAICIDISEAPPMKIPRKTKPQNSILNKVANIKSIGQCTSVSSNSTNTVDSTTVERHPSNLVISRLKKKFQCSKEEAVRKYVEKCREEKSRSNNVNNEENKSIVQNNEMPWIPNLVFPDKNHFTNLSDADHKRYVAIIMNLIQQNPEFRFAHNVTELKEFDNRLTQERTLFYKKLFEIIDSKKKSCYQFRLPYWKGMIYSCAEARSKGLKKFNRQEHESINNYECDSTIEPLPLSLLCIFRESQDNGPIVILPDLRKKCVFDSKIVHKKKVFHNNYKITSDKNAETISSNYNVKVLMDASAFSRLLIGKWGCDNLEYAFPITVTKEFVNGSLENIVTISKKIPASSPSTRTLAHKIMKYVVRGSVDKSYFDVPEEINSTSEQNLDIDSFVPSSPSLSTSPKNENNDSSHDLNESKDKDEVNKSNNYSRGKVYHVLNLNERISDSSFNILVRSNCAERDCFGNKLSVSHHIEYFPEVGAENLFPEEIVNNYIKCFFRNASHSVIFRIHNSSCNVLQKEFIDLNRLQTRVHNECLNIWKSGLQKVRNILTKLLTVSGGEYLLQEDGDSYKLYSGLDVTDNDLQDNEDYFRNVLRETNEEDRLIRCHELKSSEIFNGISYHVPLMWNFVLSRIPGSLPKKKSGNQIKFHNNKRKK
uniref:Col_cuticle_N domain-containing protein n=1 Tax=Strongyloides stercoralis TaxID=6248 RepID=A0A0K0ETF8_STRER